MAYTKIHAIKTTLNKAIDYIENPEKTEEQLLVSGYNVDPLVASIEFEMTAALAKEIKGNYAKTGGGNNLAYHMIQSFSPDDNVTPEQAHEIGKRLASEFLDGKHEYVISTHVDKGHIHNHIIFNAVSFYDYKKFQTKPYKTAAKIRAISDRLCTENNLFVIQGNQKLSRSYTEYQARKKNTSWKSEIRKRLNYVLETATSYEQFKQLSNGLGVRVDDSGKHIKYQIEGQERATRGNKLSDIDQFLPDGIKERVERNLSNQDFIKNVIRGAAAQAINFQDFTNILKEQYAVSYIREKSGIISYRINDINSEKVKERALGLAFSSSAIKSAIHEKRFDFLEVAAESNIADEFSKTVRTKVEEVDTPIILNQEHINKITVDGILIKLPDQQGRCHKIFIDNNHIDFLEDTKQYKIYIGSQYDYYYVSETLDPDVSESDQLTGEYTKGETLIRSMELENGIKPVELEISAADIKAINEKGVYISLPELGIESVFIENRYVEYDRLNGGSCKVQIYENWNYSYRLPNPEKKNVLQNIKGADLVKKLESRDYEKNPSLINRIAAMERRAAVKDTKALANMLLLMRKENINEKADFDRKIRELQSQANQVKESIQIIDNKNMQYKEVAKYLITVKKYMAIKQELGKQLPFMKKKYESKYESELKAFDYAAVQLEKLGVNTNVDPDKVIALVKEQESQAAALKQSFSGIMDRVDKIRQAKETVASLQPGEQKRESLKARDENEI